eukprot:TRINITY_DN2863_c0_g1_i2.p1 TRINITY_DN2863_c0_g1~~TRINITY_DN2863_c0_g1_i2.p1  ORF type:complete len:496 (+),score=115.75 TRINITY_DN2863_c0_g1_i2:507-1994(+)
MLKVNKTLHNIDLTRNGITDAGVWTLCKSLTHNSTLQKINLKSNLVTPESGGSYILDLLRGGKTTLIQITIDLPKDIVEEISALCEKNIVRKNPPAKPSFLMKRAETSAPAPSQTSETLLRQPPLRISTTRSRMEMPVLTKKIEELSVVIENLRAELNARVGGYESLIAERDMHISQLEMKALTVYRYQKEIEIMRQGLIVPILPNQIAFVPRTVRFNLFVNRKSCSCTFGASSMCWLRVVDSHDIDRCSTWLNHDRHPHIHRTLGLVEDAHGGPLGKEMQGIAQLEEEFGGERVKNCIVVEDLSARQGFCGTLREYMESLRKDGSLMKAPDIVQISLSLCSALSFLHQEGIPHGCLHSDSVYVVAGQDGSLSGILSDVGMWSNSAINDDRIRWLSDEIIEKDGQIRTKESDLWAMGMLLSEMLIGNIPFAELQGCTSVARAILRRSFDKIGGPIATEYPSLVEVVEDCRVLNPSARPSIDDVSMRLQKIIPRTE